MTIDELLAIAGLTANDEIPIWDAEATGEPTKKITAQNLAATVVALANLVTGIKGDAEQNYRQGNVNLTPANIGAVSTSDVINITHGGTEATTYVQARKNLQIGEKIQYSSSCSISNQQPNSKNAMTTDGTTAWYVTLEPGVYIVNIWCRERDQGGGDTYKAILWFGDGSGDQIANYQSPNWGIHNFSIIVAPTSNTTYNLYHEHNGQQHTVDAKISIVRLQ